MPSRRSNSLSRRRPSAEPAGYFPPIPPWSWILGLSCAIFSVYVGINNIRPFDNLAVDIFATLLIGSTVFVIIRIFVVMVRVRRRVDRLHGLVCKSCLYDLTESPTDGTCPECGKPYNHAQLREFWFGKDSSQP